MKKGLILLFGLLLLIGCSNNNDANQPQQDNEDQNNTENSVVENEPANEDNDTNTENTTEEDNTENATQTDSDANNDHLKEFKEFDVLAEELDLNTYEGIVESDNKGNRIILFQDADGKKEYKSIFVKNDNRLKIVHFDNEDNLLYNDVIK